MTQSLRRRSSRLRLLGSGGLFAALLLVSALAFAGENGTLIMTNGEVLSGEIVAVHQGDHVIIKLSTGEVRAIAWAQIGTLQVGAGGQIVIGGQPQPTATPTPPPQPTYTPPPQQPTYTPAPEPTYAPAPPPAPPPRRIVRWMPRFELGFRLMTVNSGGDIIGDSSQGTSVLGVRDVIGGGAGFELDAGYHVLPQWSLYGFWQHDTYSRGTKNNDVLGKQGAGNVLGLGLRWNSAPNYPVGFLLDAGIGARWINFGLPAYDAGRYYDASALGGEFRFAAGLSIGPNPHFRVEPALYFTGGGYTDFNDGSCAPSDTYCTQLDPSQRGNYWTAGVQVGAHFDL